MKKSASAKVKSSTQQPEKKLAIVEDILSSKNKVFLAITGGGTAAISTLLSAGGASSVFAGAIVPYSEEYLATIVGSYSKATSIEVSRRLSNAIPIDFTLEEDQKLISVGATSSLKKRGDERKDRMHHVCISIREAKPDKTGYLWTELLETVTFQLKADRTREQEEELVSRLILSFANLHMNGNKLHPISSPEVFAWVGLTDDDVIITFQEKVKNAVSTEGN